MKPRYLYFCVVISYCCSNTDPIDLQFATVEKISITSQRIEPQPANQNNQSVIIEGFVSSNKTQIVQMYLVWNDYFDSRVTAFDPQIPSTYDNRKEILRQESGRFIVNDTTSGVIYFSIYVKSSNHDSYSNVYLYESSTKTLTRF